MARTIPRTIFLAAAAFAAFSVVVAAESELEWHTKAYQPNASVEKRGAKGKQNFAYFTNW
jgi:hypothetical protein